MTGPWDIAIIGAGAAGLTAAIFAGEAAASQQPLPRIILLDGAATPGAKILVSGGGRCNVTHDVVSPADFHGSRNIIRNVLAAFDEKATVRWMQSLGVELKREPTGKLFPTTDRARTVLDALQTRVAALGVTQQNGFRVTAIDRGPDSFILTHAGGALHARRVVIATGGRSLPRTGSDGGGYLLVRSLGHSVTPTFAALAPLMLSPAFFQAPISGLTHEVELTARADGKVIDRRQGSMLWTHFGISGPVVMDISRFWIGAHAEGRPAKLECNFYPGSDFERVASGLLDAVRASPRVNIVTLLGHALPERLARAISTYVGVPSDLAVQHLSREARRSLVHALTALPLPVERDRGWNYAEVTAGGVPLNEIDYRTMESRVEPGLFLAGEILDCDGRIGGFNFQWAWASGYLAGKGAVKSLSGRD